ncbi:neuroligin-1 [Rhipicephalus sanguineus]|uniref:neuroligin-1 n=1 Tax=Rhipicephalus sanguineus TaxID=34632 RepID=UPI0020C536BC|nr:neuroligin-1 [Rhipicephalus sanguineus]
MIRSQLKTFLVPPMRSVFLVSAVACVVIMAGLALALVGIILGTMIPAREHSCPPLDKPLEESNIMVETKSGRLIGTLVTVHGVKLAGFLGVPFAQSTAGERRFMAPLPLPASRDACVVQEYLQQRPPCAQLRNGTVVGTEDCLHVNVWTPAAALELHGDGMGRPFVVAVSGSWFETGSNDDSDWPMLAAKGDVVVMVPNHRQGVLGFLHPSNVAGVDVDVAVSDVWSAVQWARDHATFFGGDPKQLALVGYGSGAYLLSLIAQNMSKDTARRAFYHGGVFGSLLPFNPVMPYRSLAVALRCNDSDLSVSAWLPCFRAAPVDELLQAARASSEWPLQFAPHVDIRTLQTAPASNPHTVVAGVDAADDKTLFMDRILPLAKRDGSASTTKALLEYTLNVFNVPLGVKPFIRGLFKAESADGIADTLSMISTCASLKVAKAVAEGYHYQMDSTAVSGLLQPPLGISELAQFAAYGTVPPLADKSPWPPLTQALKTRVFNGDGSENFTSYFAECRKYNVYI